VVDRGWGFNSGHLSAPSSSCGWAKKANLSRFLCPRKQFLSPAQMPSRE
jgi:hypothetical protein